MEEYNIKTKVVGVDISNESTTYAIVDVRGNILAEDSFPTQDYPDVNNFVTALSEKVVMLVEGNGGYETIRSIGVSAPSASSVSGCIENAANLPWKGVVPLSAMLRDRMGLAVGLSNDAHISALGEFTFGSAHGMKNFIIISLGVGLGSCFFTDGIDHQGNLGFAGEFGHTCVVDNGRKCGCGHEGCLEAYVGANGIVQTAHEVMAESDKPSLMRSLEKLSPRTIKECCDLRFSAVQVITWDWAWLTMLPSLILRPSSLRVASLMLVNGWLILSVRLSRHMCSATSVEK